MMGRHDPQQFLYCVLDLESRIPDSHPLRQIKRLIDFSFVRPEVAPFYGYNGNESVDPVIVLKMMLLLFLDNIPSERELMRQLGYRLDYLWFLDMDPNQAVPDHSVLSKARARWGSRVFQRLFTRIVQQCVEAGLVDGDKLHMDASMVDANASKNSVQKGSPQLIAAIQLMYRQQEQKLDEKPGRPGKRRPRSGQSQNAHQPSTPAAPASHAADLPPASSPQAADAVPSPPSSAAVKATAKPKVNDTCLSSTDPDAAIASHAPNCKSGPRPRYMSHRAVDDRVGVITAVISTPADVNEGSLLSALIQQHECTTGELVRTAVADSKYGTIENYIQCDRLNITPHMADLNLKQERGQRRGGIFPESRFIYDLLTNTYRCPAGQTLSPARRHVKRNSTDYTAPRGVCAACPLRTQCTKSQTGRSIKRHDHQTLIDTARAASRSSSGKRDRRRRRHLMEGSFADASNNHGFKRSRWRRLWRQAIQDHMIATVQNIRILVKHHARPARPACATHMCLREAHKRSKYAFRRPRVFLDFATRKHPRRRHWPC
jgi:transposase